MPFTQKTNDLVEAAFAAKAAAAKSAETAANDRSTVVQAQSTADTSAAHAAADAAAAETAITAAQEAIHGEFRGPNPSGAETAKTLPMRSAAQVAGKR